MGLFNALHRGVDSLKSLPGITHLRQVAFERRFEAARSNHSFRGVYDSFEAAQAAAPPTAPLGYDNPESADLYLHHLRAEAQDYPAFFWLQYWLGQGARSVVDLGGNVGIKFHAFNALGGLPRQARWLVVDVPAVVRKARKLQHAQPSPDLRLDFSDQYADIDGSDLLYASGTLQYLPITLYDLLRNMARPPRRLVVNTTPIHGDRSFFTLNSIGTAYCPYRVQGRGSFVAGLTSMGYKLRDEWINPGKAMMIPFTRGFDLTHYCGFCFDLQA